MFRIKAFRTKTVASRKEGHIKPVRRLVNQNRTGTVAGFTAEQVGATVDATMVQW